MKWIFALLIALALSPVASAGHCNVNGYAPYGFVQTQYLIPLGTPSYVLYIAPPAQQMAMPPAAPAYTPEAPAYSPAGAPAATNCAPPPGKLTEAEWKMVNDARAANKKAAAPPNALASCIKCHSGDAPKGGLKLDGELDCETKLASIGRILSDDPAKRMPKGKPITDAQRGALIKALTQ